MDIDLEELTLSQVAQEFRLNRSTLGVWVSSGKLPSRLKYDELGIPYRVVQREAVIVFLANRSKLGRPLKRC